MCAFSCWKCLNLKSISWFHSEMQTAQSTPRNIEPPFPGQVTINSSSKLQRGSLYHHKQGWHFLKSCFTWSWIHSFRECERFCICRVNLLLGQANNVGGSKMCYIFVSRWSFPPKALLYEVWLNNFITSSQTSKEFKLRIKSREICKLTRSHQLRTWVVIFSFLLWFSPFVRSLVQNLSKSHPTFISYYLHFRLLTPTSLFA